MILLMISCLLIIVLSSNSPYCTPSNTTCWPTEAEISTFKHSISGKLLTPTSPEYHLFVMPQNLLVTIRPYFVFLPDINIDIQNDIHKSIQFIHEHNLELSILSTGHSYFGRSFGMYNYSFQINFSQHKKFEFNEQYTTLTAESGVTLGDAYKALDSLPVKRFLPGGDGHSVGVVGYALGGGQSPLSAYLGLGIDSVISFELIVANGSRVITMENGTGIVTNENKIIWNPNNDLFWALRGGGGNAFGVILNITYKLHSYDNVDFLTNLKITYPFYLNNGTLIGDTILSHYINSLSLFTNKVNAYVSIMPKPSKNSSISSIKILFDLLYIGNITMAKNELNILSNFKPEWQEDNGAEYIQYPTFWAWESKNVQGGILREYFFASLFTQYNLTQNNTYVDNMVDYVNEFISMKMNNEIDANAMFLYVSVIMGGEVAQVNPDETSITPAFRDAALYAFSSILWENKNYDDSIIEFMDKYAMIFSSTCSIGSYFNEDRPDNNNYIQDYWGQQHYDKLTQIKNMWDPLPHLFECHHCVN